MEKPLLTLDEVAEHLRVSVATISRYIRSGALTAIKTTDGKRSSVRIQPSEYEAFLQRRTFPPTTPVTTSEE